MIRLERKSACPETVRMHLTHSPEVFNRAREYYRDFPTLRREKIAVFAEDGSYRYSLFWEKNQKIEIFAGQKYVDEYFDYDIDSPFIDYDLLDGTKAVVFETLEEYSYQITRMIRKKYPEYSVVFRDPAAELFFSEDPYTTVSETGETAYSPVMTVSSDNSFSYDREQYDARKYSSLQVLSGFLWMTKRVSFGEKNPDKTFYLIKNPIGIEGLVDVVTFSLYRLLMIRRKDRGILPVIDMGAPGDGNQFSRYGENVWSMFFEQVSDVSAEEVYQSKNVIIGEERMMIFNPFVIRELLDFDCARAVHRYLRFNAKTEKHLKEMKKQYLPADAKRILGVVGRGSDFNSSRVAGIVRKPLPPEEFLKNVIEQMKEGDYDHVFLATEDQAIFELFMESEIKDRISFVPQDRVDYRDPEQNDKMLADIYAGKERDGYRETLNYLGIIYLLSECDALLATTNCGAYRFATGLNGGKYDFSKHY